MNSVEKKNIRVRNSKQSFPIHAPLLSFVILFIINKFVVQISPQKYLFILDNYPSKLCEKCLTWRQSLNRTQSFTVYGQ